jgi:glutathione S-transferase
MIWLLPAEPGTRDTALQWIAYVNETVVPAFFRLLQAQPDEAEKTKDARKELEAALMTISSIRQGPFFFGPTFSLVDASIAPWAVRDFIVRDYRGFRREAIPAWREWAEQLERRESVVNTTSVSILVWLYLILLTLHSRISTNMLSLMEHFSEMSNIVWLG